MTDLSRDQLYRRLYDFFQTFAPREPISRIDASMRTKSPSEQLFKDLSRKYNVPFAAVLERHAKVSRIEIFFQTNAPAHMDKVMQCMRQPVAEDALFLMLQQKYGNRRKLPFSPLPITALEGGATDDSAPPLDSSRVRGSTPPPPDGVDGTLLSFDGPQPDQHRPPPPSSLPDANKSLPTLHFELEVSQMTDITALHRKILSDRAVVELLTIQLANERYVARNLKLREEQINDQEVALRAKDVAVEAKTAALIALTERSSSTSLFRPADLVDRSIEDFHKHLVNIEAKLFEKCLQLVQWEASFTLREKKTAADQDSLRERLDALEDREKKFDFVLRERDVAMASRQAHQEATLVHLEAETAELKKLRDMLQSKEKELQKRDLDTDAATKAQLSREEGIKRDTTRTQEERETAKKLSVEVIKREATVRTLEKSLNLAQLEVSKVEQEVSQRAKRLLDDEGIVKTWAADLERREMKLQSIVEQLRAKGFAVQI